MIRTMGMCSTYTAKLSLPKLVIAIGRNRRPQNPAKCPHRETTFHSNAAASGEGRESARGHNANKRGFSQHWVNDIVIYAQDLGDLQEPQELVTISRARKPD
ncbi:hypothetical protein pipiens_012202 [Culex pipiens pipiens]|uniref:Uncharacterized protein n=1 Tax=Culex pipiens pipiens TaxID=38569 RepID=A0ABD1D3A3_CULPP